MFVAKTKALISFAVTIVSLFCISKKPVFSRRRSYADKRLEISYLIIL